MKPDKINLIIATEVMKITICDHSSRKSECCSKCGWNMLIFPYVDTSTYNPIKEYSKDLNAIHEAENVLLRDADKNLRWYPYCRLLHKANHGLGEHATADQRAEAFLKTLKLWDYEEEINNMNTIPNYSITEEYIDDPHWNSGYIEYTMTFSDGLSFKTGTNPSEYIPDFIRAMYLNKKFELWWAKHGESIRNERFKDFSKKYE